MTRFLFAAAAAWLGLIPTAALAQSGRAEGVRPSATVEVLEDPAHIDEVISRLQRPQVAPADTDPQLKAKASTTLERGLKAQRPELTGDPVESNDRIREERKERRRERTEKVGKQK